MVNSLFANGEIDFVNKPYVQKNLKKEAIIQHYLRRWKEEAGSLDPKVKFDEQRINLLKKSGVIDRIGNAELIFWLFIHPKETVLHFKKLGLRTLLWFDQLSRFTKGGKMDLVAIGTFLFIVLFGNDKEIGILERGDAEEIKKLIDEKAKDLLSSLRKSSEF